MARSYSLDLRERVVAAVAAGQSCRAVAGTFKVSVASVVKWSQRFRATGSAAAKKRGWQRPYAVAGEREWLLARLAEKPDLTLRALQAELAERGLRVSCYAVWHFFEHEGISFKKKACTPASRIGQTWQDGAHSGRSIKGGLILRTWCSSTRLGPRPT
jgi:transposase